MLLKEIPRYFCEKYMKYAEYFMKVQRKKRDIFAE